MTALVTEVRRGAYADSIVLMHLQSSLADLPGVQDAGVVMGTPANLELLAAGGLLDSELEPPAADDMVIAVRATSPALGEEALAAVDRLLSNRRSEESTEFRPHGMASALRLLPDARVVAVSVPGRYAARVAEEALERGRHVFLYSDNVSVDAEVDLKKRAAARGLLVMGPDCGTAMLGGIGFGFANRVRRGAVGIVAASGTGLQAVACRVHQLGAGVSTAIGTGGRDLGQDVGGATALQGLDVLRRDPETEVLVLVSKPPSPAVARRLLTAARACGKPVVIQFIGHGWDREEDGNLRLANGLDHAADLAVELLGRSTPIDRPAAAEPMEPRSGYLRGLFAGGTLALEAQQVLAGLGEVRSNVPILGNRPPADLTRSRGHSILDLGSDEFTVGRLHPMMDQELRIRRLLQEAEDAEAGVVLLDVVLGEGSHPDPAAELAPAIEKALSAGRADVAVLIVGTDLDPQGLDDQTERLARAGAHVFRGVAEGLDWVARRLGIEPSPAGTSNEVPADGSVPQGSLARVAPEVLTGTVAAINVGLETFHRSLIEQGARSIQLDWRPPAGGDERLMELLEKTR